MTFRPAASVAALSFLLTTLACGGSPENDPLAEAIRDHLVALAPNGLGPKSWSDVTVEVLRSEAGPAGDLEVGFQAFDPREVTSATDTMRGPIYTAHLADVEGELQVSRYGEALSRSVAVMVAIDRRSRYEALLTTFLDMKDSTRMAIGDWAKPLRDEISAEGVSEARGALLRDSLSRRVPGDVLRENIANRWTAPPGHEWGVVDDLPGDGAEVIWLRAVDKPDHICAAMVGLRVPEEFSWLVGEFPVCRGPYGRYVQEVPPRTILEEIEASGGVLTPAGR